MKKTVLFVLSVALVAGMTACNQFKKLPSGIEYKILKSGNDKKKIEVGSYVTLQIINATEKDSVVFDSHKQGNPPASHPAKIQVQAPSYRGDMMEGVLKLHEGDSAVFVVNSDSLFKQEGQRPPYIKKGSKIKFYIAVKEVKTKEGFEAEQRAEQGPKDEALIQSYMKDKHITNATKTASGMYYVITKKGTGENIQLGKTAVMNYTGRLLDGTPFDSNVDPKFKHVQPFEFPVGGGRVIQGWDEGVALLNKGAKAMFIIPSTLGYGSHSMGEQIPANSVLTFDVELVDIKDAAPMKSMK